AVMMDGNVIQIGTPDQVYDDPQDLRVAEFIGSPKINVLEAEAGQGGRLSLAGRLLPVGLRQAGDGPVRIGLRPEVLRLAAQGEALIDGVVAHRENLGAEVLLHATVPASAQPVIVRLDHGAARSVSLGARIGLSFAPEAALCFDQAGRRVALVEVPATAEAVHA
ncbi:MAG: TOBE domain-containing protein, partial [Hyphomicrobiaceae bacterium]|nr:TOBE domain-containing protein [Hyphomicrobiaceae bacterium]